VSKSNDKQKTPRTLTDGQYKHSVTSTLLAMLDLIVGGSVSKTHAVLYTRWGHEEDRKRRGVTYGNDDNGNDHRLSRIS
jgi:hypothetical protein